jgi:uncharacterized membrane protein YedE/YeeE
MKGAVLAFATGLLFAVGLGISGMTQPAKVVGFLDFAGNWDPSLAFVMIGAIATHASLYRLIRRRPAPYFATDFSVPAPAAVDLPLVAGAALFGLGWGIGGFCPGPAVVSFAGGMAAAMVFLPSMLAGMILFGVLPMGRA